MVWVEETVRSPLNIDVDRSRLQLSYPPNKTRQAEKADIRTGYPDSLMMAYTTGIVNPPMMAQNPLIPLYGTYTYTQSQSTTSISH